MEVDDGVGGDNGPGNDQTGARNSPESRASARDGSQPPSKRRIRLGTADHRTKEGQRLWREMREGAIEIGDGSKLMNALTLLSRMGESSSIEVRMLEQQAEIDELKRLIKGRSDVR